MKVDEQPKEKPKAKRFPKDGDNARDYSRADNVRKAIGVDANGKPKYPRIRRTE